MITMTTPDFMSSVFGITVGVPGNKTSEQARQAAAQTANKTMVDLYRSHGKERFTQLIISGQIKFRFVELMQIELQSLIPGSRVNSGTSNRVPTHQMQASTNCQ